MAARTGRKIAIFTGPAKVAERKDRGANVLLENVRFMG
jgi:hypothetical protein